MTMTLDDEATRRAAVDPLRSFIVRAPAGSGKTELLIQRYLNLLCYTQQAPEEVLAITFTRKAAAEMRQRVLEAIDAAATQALPQLPHEQQTGRLARAVLARDQQLDWQLLEQPNRLRILTVDALSAYLVRQMPMTAQLGVGVTVLEDAAHYYREAVGQLFFNINQDVLWQRAFDTLLLHLDNRATVLETLLINLLGQRAQWLPHLVEHRSNPALLKQPLEMALSRIALEAMQSVRDHFPEALWAECLKLAHQAGCYCAQEYVDHPMAPCGEEGTWPVHLDALPKWLGLCHLLLTQQGEWRSSLTRRQGFPPAQGRSQDAQCRKQNKQRMQALLKQLNPEDALKASLCALRRCPPLTYQADQWTIIESLIELLPVLVAQLQLLFEQDNVTDFIELSLAALRALGDAEEPTDLALRLDYRISHLLVDEFQDISNIQLALIERLTEGWEPEDGRTLFLVGDPMQSIYRFRHAEVGLFIRTEQQGVGQITLQALTLRQNFRSAQAIVKWNNQQIGRIFPIVPDITSGAIPYTHSMALPETVDGTVAWYPVCHDEEGAQEAIQVLHIIQNIRRTHPEDRIAVLVRSRSHLQQIITVLREQPLDFQAVDIEPLSEAPVIREIHSITRALLHRGDRIAWLAVLRAPYCGLLLTDLWVIAKAAENRTIYASLLQYEQLTDLSEEASLRLSHLVPLLHHCIAHSGRMPFSERLKHLWEQLGGALIFSQPEQIAQMDRYWALLEDLETRLQAEPLSLERIESGLKKLSALVDSGDSARLQIMTIHKAKGLEFDHVLLPGLHRATPYDPPQLLKWLERPNLLGSSDLILAPIKAADQSTDPIYDYLKAIDRLKASYESARLLYVATSRAKKSLHLLAHVVTEEERIKTPASGSFLSLLWDSAEVVIRRYIESVAVPADQETSTARQDPHPHAQHLYRFQRLYFLNRSPPPWVSISTAQPPDLTADRHARRAGILIHEILEQIAETGVAQWTHAFCQQQRPQWERRLAGVPQPTLSACLQRISQAINNVLSDPRGRWILSSEHQAAQNEWALSTFEDGSLQHVVIDRSFIDQQGVRWIIDYKTGEQRSKTVEANYYAQLCRYARILEQYENRPIQIALYWPLITEWVEWSYRPEEGARLF